MSKPAFGFTAPPGDNQESWDADALSNFIRAYKVLHVGPWPIPEVSAPSQLPPPGSYDRCIAVVGTGTQRWLYLSTGTAWHKIGRQAAFQADSTAGSVAALRADFNAFLTKLRNSGWMRGSDPDDPFSMRVSRVGVEAWANVPALSFARLTRHGVEVYGLAPVVLETIALTRHGVELWAKTTSDPEAPAGFPRVFGGFLSASLPQINHSQGAKWETDARWSQLVVWHQYLSGPWISKLKAAYPNVIVLASNAEFMPNDGTLSPTLADWYLRSPGGAALNVGSPEPQFIATAADRRLHADPFARPFPTTGGNITAAQFIARNIMSEARPDLYAWDGFCNDWFWDNPPWALGNCDYDRNGVTDSLAVATAKFMEDRANYLAAIRAEWLVATGREPALMVNPGTAQEEPYLHAHLSAYGAEGWFWNPSWWAVFRSLQRSKRSDFGLGTKLGLPLVFRVQTFGFAECNYLAADDNSTWRTNEPPGPINPSTDTRRKINLRSRINSFGWARFGHSFACMGDGMATFTTAENGLTVYYDEGATDLGQPLSELPWRVPLGPPSPNRVPASDPSWPADSLTGVTNLYGAAFIRPFERGCVIHYVPRDYLMTTVEVTATDIQTAYTGLGLGTAPTLYRFRGTQAPVVIMVGACQDLADNQGLFGRETLGTWTATVKSNWSAPDEGLGVWGQVAYWKAAGAGSAWFRWHFRCDRTDDYDVYAVMPFGASPSSPTYAAALWTGAAIATDASYTVQHDDGGGSKTTTTPADVNIRANKCGHFLGRYRFVAGETYYVQLSDAANGVLIANGIFLQSVTERHNDGQAFTAQQLFGGIASIREYNPTGTPWKPVVGDGLFLKTTQDFIASCGGIVGNFPCHDTSPGSNHRECLYEGTWDENADLTHGNDPGDGSVGPVDTDNPYFAQQVWGFELADIHQLGYRSIAAGTSGAKARYIYRACFAGSYVVQEWHGWVGKNASGAECSSVPYRVLVNDVAQFTGKINQQTNVGRWNNVRTLLSIAPGDVIELELNAATASGGSVVISDAVRFLLL